MARFIHSADIHIGASRKLDGYLARQEQMLRQLFELAMSQADGVLLMDGDIFHRKDVKPEERDMLLRVLLHYDELGVTTLIPTGNHDMLIGEYSNLHFLKLLELEGRLKHTFVAESVPRIVDLPQHNVTFILIPWKGYSTDSFKTAVDSALLEMEKNYPSHRHIVVTGHECVSGCSTDVGWKADGEHYMKIIEDERVNYYAFGDIHKMQQLGSKSWYSGSPIQHDFGDAPSKGVLIVDTAGPVKFQELKGIKPLLTFETLPDPVPDAYIRIVSQTVDKTQIANMPENVVAVTPTPQVVQVSISGDIFSGLETLLAVRGLNQEHQRQAVELAEELKRSIGSMDT